MLYLPLNNDERFVRWSVAVPAESFLADLKGAHAYLVGVSLHNEVADALQVRHALHARQHLPALQCSRILQGGTHALVQFAIEVERAMPTTGDEAENTTHSPPVISIAP